MKILRVIPSMDPRHGGPNQGIRNSIPALQQLGVENEVVCMDDPSEPFLQNVSFVIHAIGKSKTGWAYNSTLSSWLKNYIADYDVVIVHGLWLYHSFLTIRIAGKLKGKKPKIYVMPHGMLDPWFQKDKSRRFKSLRNEIYWNLIEKHVVNNADGLFFTCEQELLLARETFKGYNPKKELNVGYGIQAPPEYMEKFVQTVAGNPYWLFLSRIHEKKGVDLLIGAYKQLKERNPDIPDLVIAGPLESSYAKNIVGMAGGDNKIHFPGLLQGNDKWAAFYGAEVFILPSHQENFGIAVVEALACGVPVLISNQVNIWREIENGGGGIIAEDTLKGTYTAMEKWLNYSLAEKNRFKLSAREVFSENFSIGNAANKMTEIIFSEVGNANNFK
ncbi:glycosyltransferase [Sphingobacterium oryzagri]|uniref:Glycosyltransferase n=1 Tax=Sphingobacterium oryzagri TaxID=3025669 RepID=A0ABY7WK68_9SPHI|nr:glycosyltransferase [Sphingobacterium sp. KACC 22765]WDF68994.1 glycosyltransferase [Sphingobacterium sp. KACC 22765]